MPSHGTVFQLQLLLPLLKNRLLVPQALLRPLDRVPLQVNPVPEELQFRAALELLRIERISQVVRVGLRVLRNLVLQVLQLLQLASEVLDG